MVKTLKNLLLQNQEICEAESWYIASGTQGLHVWLNNDPALTFDLLRQGQIFVPMHLYGEILKYHFFLKMY